MLPQDEKGQTGSRYKGTLRRDLLKGAISLFSIKYCLVFCPDRCEPFSLPFFQVRIDNIHTR